MRRVLTITALLALGATASAVAQYYTFPYVVDSVQLHSSNGAPLPMAIHHIKIDRGIIPTCVMVLRDSTTAQFEMIEVHSSNCETER